MDSSWDELERMAEAALAADAQLAYEPIQTESIERWKCLWTGLR